MSFILACTSSPASPPYHLCAFCSLHDSTRQTRLFVCNPLLAAVSLFPPDVFARDSGEWRRRFTSEVTTSISHGRDHDDKEKANTAKYNNGNALPPTNDVTPTSTAMYIIPVSSSEGHSCGGVASLRQRHNLMVVLKVIAATYHTLLNTCQNTYAHNGSTDSKTVLSLTITASIRMVISTKHILVSNLCILGNENTVNT
jgi:hypothetical protein